MSRLRLAIYLFFANLRKAFGTVGHQAMVRKMRMAGVRGAPLRFFTALHRGPRAGAKLACGTTEFHRRPRGVLQGRPGPPLAFIVFINGALDGLERGGKVGVGAPGARLKDEGVGGGALLPPPDCCLRVARWRRRLAPPSSSEFSCWWGGGARPGAWILALPSAGWWWCRRGA